MYALKLLIQMLLMIYIFANIGCDRDETASTNYDESIPNQQLLDEIGQSSSWFHAKKTQAIFAKRLEEDQTVTTIEGEEAVNAGDYLCRGKAGDIWPQTEKSLLSKYSATESVDSEGWRKYEPLPDAEGVLAAKVDHAFSVDASWGRLDGKPGDFVVKNFSDKDVEYPDDVWIVDRELFAATYSRVGH